MFYFVRSQVEAANIDDSPQDTIDETETTGDKDEQRETTLEDKNQDDWK